MFVIWGARHGLLLAVFHLLKNWHIVPSNQRRLGYWFNRQVTFLLIVIGWVFFRAADIHTSNYSCSSVLPAVEMLRQMTGLGGLHHSPQMAVGPANSHGFWMAMAALWLWCNFAPNSFEIAYTLKPRKRYALIAGATMALCILQLGTPVDFLYFRF